MKHDLDYMLQVMQAAKEGKIIEYNYDRGSWEELEPGFLNFNWGIYDYRIKPEPPKLEYVPYESAEEFLQGQKEHGQFILEINTNNYVFPLTVCEDGVYFNFDTELHPTSYNDILKYCIWQDGTPCGKLKV